MNGVLVSLESATLEELRAEWGRRFGAPPRLRSPDLLRRIIAWRIQATAEAGFDKATKRLLLKDGGTYDARLTPGTLIGRDWKGVRYEVEAADEGFLYAGRRWDSLSSIARAITGTRWNGPRFSDCETPHDQASLRHLYAQEL